MMFRRSHANVFYRKGILKNFANFNENIFAGVSS